MMKKWTWIIIGLLFALAFNIAYADVEINEETFPDPVFRQYIKESGMDSDGNGVLSDDEAEAVVIINIAGLTISSVKGIEWFPNLQILWANYCPIKSIDVRSNKILRGLYLIMDNSLTELDVSQNKELEVLQVDANQMSRIDVSNNPELRTLTCADNQITNIDVSKNPALEKLDCSNNPLTSLDVSGHTKLTQLVSVSCKLTSVNVKGCSSLENINVDGNQLSSLDLSTNHSIREIEIAMNRFQSFDVSTFPLLRALWCHENQLTSLDVSKNPALVYLACADNQLTSLDLSKNTALEYLYVAGMKIGKLDVSKNPNLTYLDCSRMGLSDLDVSHNTKLETLTCYVNWIVNLDISHCTALTELVKKHTREKQYDIDCWNSGGDDPHILNVDRFTKVIAGDTVSEPSVGVYSITVTVSDEAAGTAEADCTFGISGAVVSLTATAKDGYAFKEWQIISGGVTIDVTNRFVIGTENVEIKAIFEKLYTVTVTVSDEKAGTANADLAYGTSGTSVFLTATANEGYIFREWQVVSGGVVIDGNGFLIGTENVEIKAIFEKLYTVTVTVSDEKAGTANADLAYGTSGTSVVLTATANEGYSFREWQVISGEITISNNVFMIGTADVNILAVFDNNENPNPERMEISGAKISIEAQEYTGKAVNPKKISVTLKGTKLIKGTDYTVTYKNNKNIGKATATITGIGKYTGTKTATFSIVPKQISSASLKYRKKDNVLVFSWKKAAGGIDGYEIEYGTDKKFKGVKKAKVSAKEKKAEYKIEKPVKKKTYYVRIRTWKKVKGKKYYSEWKVVSKKVK